MADNAKNVVCKDILGFRENENRESILGTLIHRHDRDIQASFFCRFLPDFIRMRPSERDVGFVWIYSNLKYRTQLKTPSCDNSDSVIQMFRGNTGLNISMKKFLSPSARFFV